MARPWLFSILLLSGLCCSAQDATGAAYTVHGTVINAQTNQPIARAEVILDQEYAVLTGNEGQFEFDQIPAGDYQVSVGRPGYIPVGNAMLAISGRRGLGTSPRPGRLIRVGLDMPDLTFALVPDASIRGQVSLSASDDADGVRVSAYQKQWTNGRTHWQTVSTATTDSEGFFHFENLAPGTYMLFSSPSLDMPAAAARGAAISGYPAVYYPGGTDAASAGVLTLTAGQTVEANLSLTRQAFYPVTAQVRGLDSGIHAGFQILDSLGRSTNLQARYDPREQVVRANVPNGSWILQAQSFGLGGPHQEHSFGRTAFQVANGPINVAVTIQPIPRLQVTIHREFTPTVDTASLPATVRLRGPGISIQLENADPFTFGGMFGSQFDPNSDPSADTTSGTIDAIPGRYWVEADTWMADYVSSISSGGVDLASNPLVISPNSSNSPIEIVLRNDVGTIEVQIASQAGSESGAGGSSSAGEAAQTHVYAIPLFPTTANIASADWASNGRFTLPKLAPGSYRVVACDSEQEIDFHTPEGLAAWAGKGQVVTVDPGGTARVTLSILHVEQEP